MREFFKRLFCRHENSWLFIGITLVHSNKIFVYSQRMKTYKCTKCGKVKLWKRLGR
jgi:hypothetical protein